MGKVFKRPGRTAWHYKVRLANGSWQMRRGYTDKRATEEKQAREQRAIERGEAGLVDQFLSTREALLEDLVPAFTKALLARARAKRYVQGLQKRLALVFEVTGARYLTDLDAPTVEGFLGRLVRGEGLPPMPARPNSQRPVPRGPAAMKTRDGYVEALRTFGSWLYSSERWGSNPFGRLRKEARESDRTMEHRALSVAELDRLVEAAEVRNAQQWIRGGKDGGGHANASPAKLAELEALGHARGTLYLFAAYSGLRLNECRNLLRGHLVLDGEEPHVLVRAATAKARTEKRVPLVAAVVVRLREHLKRRAAAAVRAGKPVPSAAQPVFEMPRGLLLQLRKDAAFAGLGLHDDVGRRLTFHGFRASTATLLARAGVSPGTAMRVLRHSDANLTLRVYAKLGLADVHRELREKLAPQVAPNASELRAAVGQSMPLAPSDHPQPARRESPMAPRVVPQDAAPCRSEHEPAGAGEMVGRAGFEPACGSGGNARAIGPTGPTMGTGTTGGTKEPGGGAGGAAEGADPDDGDAASELIARLAQAARALLRRHPGARGRPPLPQCLRADLQKLLDDAQRARRGGGGSS